MVHAKPFPRPEWELCSRLAAAAQGWVPPAAVRGGASSPLRRTVWVGFARRDPSAKIAPPAGLEAEGQPAWGARCGSDSASASTCAHLPRTTSSTFVAADETARIRNEQRASNLWCDPGRGRTCVRCYTSSCALVAPAVTAAANRSPTESGVIGAAGVRSARVCRFAEIHSYGSDNQTAGGAARGARAGTTNAGTARAR